MKIIGTKKQTEAAYALSFVMAAFDKMYKEHGRTENDLYSAVLAECFAVAEVIGGCSLDCLVEFGFAEDIPRLHSMGYGVVETASD